MKLKPSRSALALCVLLAGASPALAQSQCDSVSFSDIGWTDITTTTSVAKQILQALDYDVEVSFLSLPVTIVSLSEGDMDVFLGNWMPAQTGAMGKYLEDGSIETVHENLKGTIYSLAVPTYTYEKGMKVFSDIPKFADSIDGKIYGIEPGSAVNDWLSSAMKEGKFGWKDLELIESSEQGMLLELGQAYKDKEDFVFVGWAPHPMNFDYDIKYLTGGEEFFGSEGVVNTVTRKGFSEACPNVGKFLGQLTFTVGMESQIMGAIQGGMDPDAAVRAWIGDHPDVIDPWLDGVTTKGGEPGLSAVKEALGL